MEGHLLTSSEKSRLLSAADAARDKAYAPFSGMTVGAAVLAQSDRIYSGCNVENSSYGLTICAERAAVFAAVAAEGGTQLVIKAVAVSAAGHGVTAPCGACRQVIYEFGQDAIVLFPGVNGMRELSMAELLPEPFRLRGGPRREEPDD